MKQLAATNMVLIDYISQNPVSSALPASNYDPNLVKGALSFQSWKI